MRIPDLYPKFVGRRRAWMYWAVNPDPDTRGVIIALNGIDEFMMLVLGASPADAMLLADRLLERVADTPVELTDGSTLAPRVSIGIATAPGDARDPRELIHRADTAGTGRNPPSSTIVIFVTSDFTK